MRHRIPALTVAAMLLLTSGCLFRYQDDDFKLIVGLNGGDLHGTVKVALWIGPIEPVARPGVTNEAPLANATVEFEPENGGALVRAVSDAEGRIEVLLPPGTYEVRALSPTDGPLPVTPAPEHIELDAGNTIELRLDYDSGIR